jgi:hypothetical protein
MAEFKKGDRVVFTKDDAWWERGELVARMPAGTLGTYLGTRAWREAAPWVRLDTGEDVLAWADRIAPAEDHGTGEFKTGDRIRAVRDTTSLYGTPIPKGTTGTVFEAALAVLEFHPDDSALEARLLRPEDFERVEDHGTGDGSASEFKMGDHIRAVRDTSTLGGRAIQEGEQFVVEAPADGRTVSAADFERVEDHGTGDGSASDICAEPGCNCDLERRFPAPLDPSKVKAGDTVTVKAVDPESPFVMSGLVEKAEDATPENGATAAHLTIWGRVYTVGRMLTLTSHQPAPEPEPVDERIDAWERIAGHPVFSPAYDGDGPLIDSMIAVLDRIAPEPAPYTPTREQIRQAYVDARVDTDLITESEAGAEFDRWLDSRLAEAWEEGAVSRGMYGDVDEPNPYREGSPS